MALHCCNFESVCLKKRGEIARRVLLMKNGHERKVDFDRCNDAHLLWPGGGYIESIVRAQKLVTCCLDGFL